MSYRIKLAVTLSILIVISVGVMIFREESAKRPSVAAERPHNELVEPGKATPGWIGILIQEVTPEVAKGFDTESQEGVLVADVERDGPASKAGLKPGDFIFEYNRQPMRTLHDLSAAVADTEVGTRASLRIIRNGKELSIDLVVGKRPPLIAQRFRAPGTGDRRRLGIIIEDVNTEIKALMNLSSGRGVLVIEVVPGSPAESGGVEPGDIIHEINSLPIYKASDLMAAMRDLQDDGIILLSLERHRKLLRLAIER